MIETDAKYSASSYAITGQRLQTRSRNQTTAAAENDGPGVENLCSTPDHKRIKGESQQAVAVGALLVLTLDDKSTTMDNLD